MLLRQELIKLPNNLCKSLNLSGANISPPQKRMCITLTKNHYDEEKYYLYPILLSREYFTLEKD